jgi:hypothetical protein
MTRGHIARIVAWSVLGILLIHIFPSTAAEAHLDISY